MTAPVVDAGGTSTSAHFASRRISPSSSAPSSSRVWFHGTAPMQRNDQ